MKISQVISFLEGVAHPSLQEDYDNAGLITGDEEWDCTGILCSLDATEDVVDEAISKKCNLLVSHHPIIFRGLKKINGKNYVEKAIIKAIRNNIAIYAIHTNLDNVIQGVNGRIADLVGIHNRIILGDKQGGLVKLFTFVPTAHAEVVRNAVFEAGAGQIGNYSECSFDSHGKGTYRPGENTSPFAGEKGKRHTEEEVKLEVILPGHLATRVLAALQKAHPYEEVAYDLVPLTNAHPGLGAGIIGDLDHPMEAKAFLAHLMAVFNLSVIRHTPFVNNTIKRVAVCGGAGSFVIAKALRAGADIFVTADIKYHEFFDAEGRMIIADVGHYESEQFTIALLQEILAEKFPTFAVLKTSVNTNPVRYFS